MKRLYLGSIYDDGANRRFDIDERTVEHCKLAKQQVEENKNGMDWTTTIDIQIPDSAITTLKNGKLSNDQQDNGQSHFIIEVALDRQSQSNAVAEIGAYNEEGFMNHHDFWQFDVAGDQNIYFGPFFLRAATGKDLTALIHQEDTELFRTAVENAAASSQKER